MTEALSVRGLDVLRDGRAILRELSFSVSFGSVTAIIGPNGAGKSSLLRALTGLLPYRGSVLCEGREVRALAPRERAQRIAYVPQHSQLAANMRVREVVAQGRFAHTSGWSAVDADAPNVQRALVDAHVWHLRERAFNQLSGGEQRRVLLARALATEAPILLLDEPTAGLDLAHVLRFHALVQSLAQRGMAVICVLHELLDVYHHADRALLVAAGTQVTYGTATEVVCSPEVERVYGVRMKALEAPFELVRP
ncbi:MAG TPA: ABC transporter ATP-binding protein [Polyangiales bacterium]